LRVLVGAFETVIDHQKRWKCKKKSFCFMWENERLQRTMMST
jgi:hypothetical protein